MCDLRVAVLAGVVFLAGFLPFSNKKEPTELFPVDSVSRSLALSTRKDVPDLDWSLDGGALQDHYLATIQFGNGDTLWAADLASHDLMLFTANGILTKRLPSDVEYPYLSGSRGDSVAVFGAGSGRLCLAGPRQRCMTVPSVTGPEVLSSFIYVGEQWIVLKNLSETGTHELVRLTPHGEPVDRRTLRGPRWRFHGPLLGWEDAVASLSSYRPTVDIWYPSGSLDTLALSGFDSPMLARSRSFVRGDIDEPPTMIGSAEEFEGMIFLLNLRPGVLRIDLFDSTGRLVRILEREYPEPTSFTPADLAVQRIDSSQIRIAVSSTRARYGPLSLSYDSRLEMYRTQH
jgi:hypothetical protein